MDALGFGNFTSCSYIITCTFYVWKANKHTVNHIKKNNNKKNSDLILRFST